MENLGRGLVAQRTGDGVLIQWRLLGTDSPLTAFNVYRASGEGEPVRLNAEPLSGPTHFIDQDADASHQNAWFVRPIIEGQEQPASAWFTIPPGRTALPYLSIPILPHRRLPSQRRLRGRLGWRRRV